MPLYPGELRQTAGAGQIGISAAPVNKPIDTSFVNVLNFNAVEIFVTCALPTVSHVSFYLQETNDTTLPTAQMLFPVERLFDANTSVETVTLGQRKFEVNTGALPDWPNNPTFSVTVDRLASKFFRLKSFVAQDSSTNALTNTVSVSFINKQFMG